MRPIYVLDTLITLAALVFLAPALGVLDGPASPDLVVRLVVVIVVGGAYLSVRP